MNDSLDRHDLLERLTVAAGERQLAEKTISAYRRTWLQLIAWSTAEEFALETLPREKAREYYDALTAKRGASHHLQVRAAISALYRQLDTPNAFRECLAPRFDIERVELKYLPAPQIAMLLGELRANSGDYFGTLTFHLAEALFHTGKRYHEWAGLHRERLVAVGEDLIARMRMKGGKFADVPVPAGLASSLRSWLEFLDAAKGARLRRGSMGFVASPLVFPGRDGNPVSNQAFNARLREACRRAAIPVITAHGLRHSAATILLNRPGGNLRKVQRYLQHRSLATTARYTHVEHSQLREMADELEEATGNRVKV